MDKKLVFISHITEDKEYAKAIKDWLDRAFLNAIQFFVSSDNSSMPIGKEWAKEIKAHLEKTSVMFVIISDLSVERKWLYFESGSAYIKNVPVIPICVNGYKISKLSPPLSFFQGIELPNERDEKKLLEMLAKEVELYIPNPPYKLELMERDFEITKSTNTEFKEEQLSKGDIQYGIPLTKRNSLQLFNNLNTDLTQTINELLFVINLHFMSGNSSEYDTLLTDIKKEFSTHKLISKAGLVEILKKIEESNATFKSTKKDSWSEGYDRVRNVLSILLPQFPNKQECKERILNYPIEVWLTVLAYKYYFGFSFKQVSSFKSEYHEMLIDKDNGKEILPIVEDQLIKGNPSESSYNKLLLTSRALLGKEFDKWFLGLKGMSVDEELKREREKEIAEREMRLKQEQLEMEREKLYLERRKMEKDNSTKE